MSAPTYGGDLRGPVDDVANEVSRRIYEQLEDNERVTTMGGLVSDLISEAESLVLGWIDHGHEDDSRFGDPESYQLAQIHQAVAEYLFTCTKAYLARPDVAERLSQPTEMILAEPQLTAAS